MAPPVHSRKMNKHPATTISLGNGTMGDHPLMKHHPFISRYTGTLSALACDLGDLRYDVLATVLQDLSAKINSDGNAESERGQKKLSVSLHACAYLLAAAAHEATAAWETCEPFMLSVAELLAKSCPIANVKSGERYVLVPGTEEVTSSARDVPELLAICNEPRIYDLLFAKRCAGEPYATADAEMFLTWAARGWRDQTHFVYLLRDGVGQIVGAIDIKSANRESAEIGYWLSCHHSGIMTGAVQSVTERAREAGYVELFALVRQTNMRSTNVLIRAGFIKGGTLIRNETVYDRWVRVLA